MWQLLQLVGLEGVTRPKMLHNNLSFRAFLSLQQIVGHNIFNESISLLSRYFIRKYDGEYNSLLKNNLHVICLKLF